MIYPSIIGSLVLNFMWLFFYFYYDKKKIKLTLLSNL